MSSGVWGVSLAGPEWGRVGSFQYQTRCCDCRVLFVHVHASTFLCGKCAKKRGY